ncbi:MAG TPA: hypothetical protein VK118_08780 [Tetragenococcus sp.]|nr:hypothetical protein [Tetragenococcus sp.]
MKEIRRFGFMIVVLIIGIMIGHFGLTISSLIICPLLTLWLLSWDEKKYKQTEYKRQLDYKAK